MIVSTQPASVAMHLLVNDDYDRGRNEDGRPVPVPMLPSEVIRIETATFWAKVVDKTIREWAKVHGIGRQADRHSPLHISFPALLMKMDGELATLERLRNGERDHPAVQFYLKRAVDLHEAHRREPPKRREDL